MSTQTYNKFESMPYLNSIFSNAWTAQNLKFVSSDSRKLALNNKRILQTEQNYDGASDMHLILIFAIHSRKFTHFHKIVKFLFNLSLFLLRIFILSRLLSLKIETILFVRILYSDNSDMTGVFIFLVTVQ